jgi:CubicO group peptidase (beta-lactamase class C family)
MFLHKVMDPAIAIVSTALADRVCGAAQLVVSQGAEQSGSWAGGRACALGAATDPADLKTLDPENAACTGQTWFDGASLTKVVVATALMRAVQDQKLKLTDPVGIGVPGFVGRRSLWPYEHPLQPGQIIPLADGVDPDAVVDLEQVTFWHLLTHTSGLPAWRPLYQQADAGMAKQMAIGTPFADLPGHRFSYSDIGFIVLGLALEHLYQDSLDQVLRVQVLDPLGIRDLAYRPLTQDPPPETLAATEVCPWRGHRLIGEVHDQNAARLNGIAGHAGLFGPAQAWARLGQSFLGLPGQPAILDPNTITQMTQLQHQSRLIRRGLGFALRSEFPGSSGYPFSDRAFGHTGFTGTSLWVDPARHLVVALITNSVFEGRDNDQILDLRLQVHQAIAERIPLVY